MDKKYFWHRFYFEIAFKKNLQNDKSPPSSETGLSWKGLGLKVYLVSLDLDPQTLNSGPGGHPRQTLPQSLTLLRRENVNISTYILQQRSLRRFRQTFSKELRYFKYKCTAIVSGLYRLRFLSFSSFLWSLDQIPYHVWVFYLQACKKTYHDFEVQ